MRVRCSPCKSLVMAWLAATAAVAAGKSHELMEFASRSDECHAQLPAVAALPRRQRMAGTRRVHGKLCPLTPTHPPILRTPPGGQVPPPNAARRRSLGPAVQWCTQGRGRARGAARPAQPTRSAARPPHGAAAAAAATRSPQGSSAGVSYVACVPSMRAQTPSGQPRSAPATPHPPRTCVRGCMHELPPRAGEPHLARVDGGGGGIHPSPLPPRTPSPKRRTEKPPASPATPRHARRMALQRYWCTNSCSTALLLLLLLICISSLIAISTRLS